MLRSKAMTIKANVGSVGIRVEELESGMRARVKIESSGLRRAWVWDRKLEAFRQT